MFRVRIDRDKTMSVNDWCEKAVDFAKLFTSKYFVMYHLLVDNPHIHMYVDAPMYMSDPAFRQRVKRFFNIQNSTDYSIKKCDPDRINEYISYMFNTKHGNCPQLLDHNLDSTFVSQCEESAKMVSEEYENSTRKREKVKGPTMYQLGMELYDMIHEYEEPTIRQYTHCAISILHKHHKTSEPNMLIKVISTAMSRHQPDRLVRKVQEYFKEE